MRIDNRTRAGPQQGEIVAVLGCSRIRTLPCVRDANPLGGVTAFAR
jgi:hypothetical protein